MTSAGDAKVIFAANNSVTITGTIDGASSDEGTIQVTGATKTFASAIGTTQALTLIDIDNTSTFNEAISATNINVADSVTATAKKAITATAIVLDAGTLVLSDNNSVTIAGTINGSNTTEGTLQITGATKTFSGAIGTTQALTLIDVDNAAIFNGSIEATTLSVAASNYALELNGAANVITNAVTFSNTGALTLGDANTDSSTFNGGITATAPSGVTLAGTIQTSGDTISIGDSDTAITLAANTIVDGNTAGDITLAGAIDGGYSLTLNTTGTTTLSGEIGGSTALTTLTTNASGTTVISVDIETSSTQTYNDAVTVNGTLDFTGSTVQFVSTLAGDDGTGDNLTISGALDLDGAATSLTSLTVEGASNLGANVTTSGTQTYTGAVTLSGAARTLTTAGSAVTFSNTVNGAQDLTVDTNGTDNNSSLATVQFGNTVGNSTAVGAVLITGNLDLNAAVTSATSLEVTGTSDLGANVTTSGTQTYTGASTISANITLTTSDNDVTFSSTTNAGSAGDTLDIDTGTGDLTFTGAVGGSTALGNITIDTAGLTAAAIKLQGTLDITNSAASSITGVISNGASAASLTKAGAGTLTLSGTNTYTGATTVNNGTLTVSGSGKLGNGNYTGTLTVASGKTFNYSSSSAQTFSDWGAGTGTINLNGSDEVTLSGNQDFTGTLNVSQMLIMVGVNGNTEIAGLGNATTIDIQNGGTIKIQHVNHNAFLGYQSTGAPDIYIRTGGELTTDDENGAYGIHIGGSLTLDGGTLSWEEASGDYSINSFAGTWTLDQDVVVTDDSLISAPGLVSLETDGNTTFTVSENKTLTVSGYFYNSSTHTEVAVEKAGAGTMILQAAGTHPAAFTVSAGTLKVTADDALGTTAAGTTVASGATLDLANVTYSTTEAVTVNGGTISTSTGTSSFAGAITLGAHSTFDVDGTQLTVSGNVTDGDNTYNITKTGNGILVLSNTTNSYDGTTTISAGTLTVTGRLDSGTYSANIINNSALIYNSTSAQEFSGVVSGTGTLEKAMLVP
jgi:autotransporter-associated beta strand protein